MISPAFAELAGLFAADGCMQDNGRTRYVCFWGNITEDRKHYDEYISHLFQKEFGIVPRLHEKKSNSVYGFYCCSKHVVERFKSLGFHAGSKTYTVEVPLEILHGSADIQIAFIRGFFDGDGSLSFQRRPGPTYSQFNQTHHVYPRIEITSASLLILRQMKSLLNKFEIHATIEDKIQKKGTFAWRIMVRGKRMLDLWMSIIGTNNPAQKSRYLLWKKQGFCPTHTTLVERQIALAES